MTFLHTYTYKKGTNIFIMQMLVAYFFIFIERFTQSYEHNLALSTGRKIPGQSRIHILSRVRRGRKGEKEKK